MRVWPSYARTLTKDEDVLTPVKATASPGNEPARNPPRVTLTLPWGWVDVPPPNAPRRGLLKRDPFEVLAREFVASGAVIRPLLRPTRDYLHRIAQADPNPLRLAAHIAAPTRTDTTFANVLVLGPVLVPRLGGGDVDWDEISRRAALPAASRAGGKACGVERVSVPWGAAVKVSWTPNRGTEGPAPTTRAVGYWVLPNHLASLIVIHGDVSAGSTDESCRLLSEIDAMVMSMTVLPG